MITKGFFVRLEAKPGSEMALKRALMETIPMAEVEDLTPIWFVIQFSKHSFGLFDAYEDDHARDAHWNGIIPSTLREKAKDLLASTPSAEKIDVLGSFF